MGGGGLFQKFKKGRGMKNMNRYAIYGMAPRESDKQTHSSYSVTGYMLFGWLPVAVF